MLDFFLYMGFCLFILFDWWLVVIYILLGIFILLFYSIDLFYICNLSYFLMCDFLSMGMVMLLMWIFMLGYMASYKVYLMNFYGSLFNLNNMIMLIMLLVVFFNLNIFMFYIFFEMSLIPMLILIMGWGYQGERIQAGLYLIFYTLFMSLPLMGAIFYLYLVNSSMGFFIGVSLSGWIFYMFLILAFLVKMPMYFFHLWLLKAHVEAPIFGSMILAGIMLKLGGYGLMRFMLFICIDGVEYNYIWVVISMLGGFYMSLVCMVQFDMKLLIAGSSVVHMSLVIGGLMSLTGLGYMGSYILMIGHGFCSSGMFCLANLSYERFYSRSLMINKGLISFMPILSLWWFLLISSNMAAPPTINLLGEILLMIGILFISFFFIFTLIMISFFSVVYGLGLYIMGQHGKVFSLLYSFCMVYSREYLLLLFHWLPVNLMILNVDFVLMYF
uniref:NADH-ubiquinone oxidoreductase chain 4 n=1 Tax=Pseudoneureclipsis sibuyana TaxID=2904893 RepID=A0A9E8RSN6_9NEOP|nr:NADH dehydrogenase subunit 4 [Pseudoneureclipsis sibuyana]UZZ44296.1 NADH dehydrogenase subunit 4 [Pseudoneureclipsis sibuyana]